MSATLRSNWTRTLILAAACAVALAAAAQAQVVISQIYGAGGNAGAVWNADYVELLNEGTTAADISGWSIQYASTVGSSWSKAGPLTGTIQPGGHYLARVSSTGSNGAALPAVDFSSTAINMSATVGKVALVKNDTLITNGTNCPGVSTIADFVGFGTGTNCFEGAGPTATPSTTLAAYRLASGHRDTNSNSADFVVARPQPRNATFITSDSTAGGSTIEGTRSSNEYGPGNAYQYNGDGNGFSGILGGTSARLYFNSDANSLYVGLNIGADFGGSTEDVVVVYLDTRSGGYTDATMSDTGDNTRKAITNLGPFGNETFPAGFQADFAIGFSRFGIYSFELTGSSLNFLSGTNASGSGTSSAQFREIRIPYSSLGGFSPGGSIDFFAALVNASGGSSGNGYLSNNSIPPCTLNSGADPGDSATGTYNNFDRYVTFACTAPSIGTHPGNQTVCENGSASFTVSATGTAPLTYQWRRGTTNLTNGGNISNADTATLTINPAALGDAASDYNCVVSNACGSATSNNASLTVNALPTPPTSASVDTPTYCTNAAPANISLTATDGSGTTLEWFSGSCGGTAVGTGSPLVIAAPGATTTYYARWTNTCGSSTCASVTVTVSAPTAATAANGGPYCVNDTIELTGGPDGMSAYSWTGPNSFSANIQNPTIASAQLTDSGTYTLTITDANGCIDSESTTVTVQNCVSTGACCLPDGTCDAGGDQTYCTGLGGVYHGTGSLCAPPVICPQPTNSLPQCCADTPAIDGTLAPGDGWMLVSEAGFTNPIRGGQAGSSDFIGESSATLLFDASGPTTTDISTDTPSNTADIQNLYLTWDANNLYIAVSGPTGHFTGGATDRLDLFVAIDTGNSPTSTRTPTKSRFTGGGLLSKNIDFAGWSPDYLVAIENVESGAGYGQLVNAAGTVLASDSATNVANAGDFELGGSRSAALTEVRIAWSALGGAPPTSTGEVWNFAVYTTGDSDNFDAYDTAPGYGQGVSQYPNFEQLGDVPNDGDWCGSTNDPVTGATDPSCPDAESDDTVGTGNGVLAGPSSDNIDDGDIDTISAHFQVRNVGARDTTGPTFTAPASRTVAGSNPVYADAGACVATLTAGEIGAPTALNDNCVPLGNLVTSWSRSDSAPNLTDPFDPGTTTITWTVSDGCNLTSQNQLIEVLSQNLLVIDVSLRGMPAGTLTRCIDFELRNMACDPQTWSEELTFSAGLTTDYTIAVPCGQYKCLTAQDALHTLTRRLDNPGDLAIVAKNWDASFTTGTTDLIGGDLYDDNLVDIVDFGVYVAAWGWTGPGSTDCSTVWPHPDLNGDGALGAGDLAFVLTNFLQYGPSACACNAKPASLRGPRTSITLRKLNELGLAELTVADLNSDGVLDTADVQAFLNGARPKQHAPKPSPSPLDVRVSRDSSGMRE